MRFAAPLFFAVCLASASACGPAKPVAATGVEEQSGLKAVRLIGPSQTLKKMAEAAAKIRWTESRYDEKGRLVLLVPSNYTSDDFGALLQAIGPYTSGLDGLQMIGPHGGVVDDKGVEHPDE